MSTPIHAQLTDAMARELYRRLYPGPIGTHDHYRTPESDLAENDRAYQAWDEGRQGYAPRLICTEVAEHVASVLMALPNIAVVELPKSPSEYWGPNHNPQWNHYPFTRVDGDEIEIGARCEHVFRTNVIEARVFAADVLAAADVAEAHHG
ncbi:hypothetical protein [Mycobacterium sp. DL440]|uniref:hypothetical protein n=1 Tax=Mycobacterium sp. DL440 TaxID=2675523 RepID=UPI001AAE61B3|nr:hypothetical protein [Mycobacterium sp. DL440]